MRMKNVKFILSFLLVACWMSCSNNSYVEPNTSKKNLYAHCTFVNASDYYAIAYMDGVEVCQLKPGSSYLEVIKNTSFSYAMKITLHKIKDSEYYYVSPEKTYEKETYFMGGKSYKMTITNEKVYSESVEGVTI